MEKIIRPFEIVYDTATGHKGRVTAKKEDYFSGNIDYYIEWVDDAENPHGAWYNESRLLSADNALEGLWAKGTK